MLALHAEQRRARLALVLKRWRHQETHGKEGKAAVRRRVGNKGGARVQARMGPHHKSVGCRVDSLKVKRFFTKHVATCVGMRRATNAPNSLVQGECLLINLIRRHVTSKLGCTTDSLKGTCVMCRWALLLHFSLPRKVEYF